MWYTGVIREECQLLSIRNVAKYILGRNGTGVSSMKLHKLCYFIQGWHLAINREPMFPEGFEAWDYGPVSAELEEIFRGRSYISRDDEGFTAVEDNLTGTRNILSIRFSVSMTSTLLYNSRTWCATTRLGLRHTRKGSRRRLARMLSPASSTTCCYIHQARIHHLCERPLRYSGRFPYAYSAA